MDHILQKQMEQAKAEQARLDPFMKEMLAEYEHDDLAGVLIAVTPFCAGFELKAWMNNSAIKLDENGFHIEKIKAWINDPTKSEDQKFKAMGNTLRILRNLEITLKNVLKQVDALNQQAKVLPGIDKIYAGVHNSVKQVRPKDL